MEDQSSSRPTGGNLRSMNNWELKSCCNGRRLKRRSCVDRLSSLPDELLGRILSLLPTKDAVATQLLSKRMQQAFPLVTALDLDDFPISHCMKFPHLVDRFCKFESFADNAIQRFSLTRSPLTRFRLRVGGDKTNHCTTAEKFHMCDHNDYKCFPDIEPARLNAWMCFPLTSTALRELDLSFQVNTPGAHKLHPAVFTCQTLEVLKLDSNIELDGTDFPLICLPNLKLLRLHSFTLPEDGFVTRIVSSCPVLEDLAVTHCWWEWSDRLTISSNSLRRLAILVWKCDQEKNSELVLINAPNLRYFSLNDNLALRYSISDMTALVKAEIVLGFPLQFGPYELGLQSQLTLIKPLSNVQQLSLRADWVQEVHYGGGFKGQLPVFHNLKTLELGGNSCCARWDIALLETLHCSPILETLSFPDGFFFIMDPTTSHPDHAEVAATEIEFWTTTRDIPSCCKSCLKQIIVKNYIGTERELSLIKYFLSKASVLQDLVISLVPNTERYGFPDADQMSLEGALHELPRGSPSCLVRVQ